MMLDQDGNVRTDKEAQELIRQSIERHGRFILSAPYQPAIGEVAEFAGLPWRTVRYVTAEEACAEGDSDLWGPVEDAEFCYHFEVEVAD